MKKSLCFQTTKERGLFQRVVVLLITILSLKLSFVLGKQLNFSCSTFCFFSWIGQRNLSLNYSQGKARQRVCLLSDVRKRLIWFTVGTQKRKSTWFRTASAVENNTYLTILGIQFDPTLNWLQNIQWLTIILYIYLELPGSCKLSYRQGSCRGMLYSGSFYIHLHLFF